MSEATEGLHVDERRLAAILAADVAGYSRLMGRNEEETVRELEAHQAAILPLIAKHGGSIVNIAGDGVVAQFPSAVRAVECAVAIQKITAERNCDVPADRRMLLRIGVNLGDIIQGSSAFPIRRSSRTGSPAPTSRKARPPTDLLRTAARQLTLPVRAQLFLNRIRKCVLCVVIDGISARSALGRSREEKPRLFENLPDHNPRRELKGERGFPYLNRP